MKKNDEVKVMDDSILENMVGSMHQNNQRMAYALKTLIDEVLELFPETPYEISNFNGRNTALDVTFELISSNQPDELYDLLFLATSDDRVQGVILEDDKVLVSLKADTRTQDIRRSFGLADALDILVENEGTSL